MAEFRDTRVFVAQLEVRLKNRPDNLHLGNIKICARVCFARLCVACDRNLVLSCRPGEKCHGTIILSSVGSLPLDVSVSVSEPALTDLTFEKMVRIMPHSVLNFDLEFKPPSGATNYGRRRHELRLQVLPGGPVQTVVVVTVLEPGPGQELFPTPKFPTLKLGRIADPPVTESKQQVITRFPLDADRSAVHWFAVEVGQEEVQVIQLQNTSDNVVCLDLFIRESDWFHLVTPTGRTASCQMTIGLKETREVCVVFCPLATKQVRGKLVLKPRNNKGSGKCFKASLSLFGIGGSADIQVLDVEPKSEAATDFEIKLEREPPVTTHLRLQNSGSRAGFVRLVCEEELRCESGLPGMIRPDSFLLGPGELRSVQLIFGPELKYNSANVVIFTGPELARRILRRAQKLTDASLPSGSPARRGLDLTEQVPSEDEFLKENFTGELFREDESYCLKKTQKRMIRFSFPPKRASFDQLPMEETMSETLLESRGNLTSRLATSTLPHSPPTTDAESSIVNSFSRLELLPRRLELLQGAEVLIRIINKGAACVHWDLNWPHSHLSVSPPAGTGIVTVSQTFFLEIIVMS
jgi:hypothetical protein